MGAWRRAAPWLALALVTGTGALGCSSPPPDAAPAADTLADALSSGDLTSVVFVDRSSESVQAELDEIVAGMAPATAQVTVADLAAEDDVDPPASTATLDVAWDLDGPGPSTEVWSYSSEARLSLVGGEDDDPAQWAVVWSPALVHPDLSAGGVLVGERRQPPRADIVSSTGTSIVTARPVARVGIDKVRLGDADQRAAARELAEVVGISPAPYVDAVVAAGDEAFVEAIVLRRADADRIAADIETIPGARALPDELPLAPTRDFARPLLGTVGTATAEVVEDAAGAVAGTDLVGLSGLQARYDTQLRGTPGYTVDIVTQDEPPVPLYSQEPQPGEALVVTLDPDLQSVADRLLADEQSPSALVAMRPSSGELLAVASGPGSDGYSTATLGQYAPGSVFKMATALALLRSGITPDEPLPCTSTVTVDGKPFTNYSDYPSDALGDIALRRAFAESCNTAFISQVDVLDWEQVAAAAAHLGIGGTTDLGFDAFPGQVGSPTSRVEQAAGLIGQGPVLLSPLAAATMAASSVAGPVIPVLLPEVVAPAPTPSEAWDELGPLQEMMRLTVTDGTATVVADVPGPPVRAKTGTAEFGSADPPDTHGWMVAVQDDLAVAVFVEQAESGSATAGPILAAFLSEAAGSSRQP